MHAEGRGKGKKGEGDGNLLEAEEARKAQRHELSARNQLNASYSECQIMVLLIGYRASQMKCRLLKL